MRLMMKSAAERMLDTEMDVHLGHKSLAGTVDQRTNESATSTTREKSDKRRIAKVQLVVGFRVLRCYSPPGDLSLIFQTNRVPDLVGLKTKRFGANNIRQDNHVVELLDDTF